MTRPPTYCPACNAITITYRHDSRLRHECTRCSWEKK